MKNPETTEQPNQVVDRWAKMAKEAIRMTQKTEKEKSLKTPEEKLSEFFGNKEFLTQFESCNDEEKGRIVMHLINCYVLFNDDDEVEERFNECFSIITQTKKSGEMQIDSYDFGHKMANFFINSVVEKLGISKQDPNYERTVFDYFDNHININGYGFHAYNGVYDESIKTKGLQADRESSGTVEKAKKLKEEVFSHYRGSDPFLYYLNDEKNGKVRNIFYDLTPRNVYSYGVHSPEWFTIFTDAFKRRENSFINRDIEGAHADIDAWCNNRDVPEEDRQKILEFFNENWEKFAKPNLRPKVALIPRRDLRSTEGRSSYDSFKRDSKIWHISDDDFLEHYVSLFLDPPYINYDTNKNIPADHLKIIDLPPIIPQ